MPAWWMLKAFEDVFELDKAELDALAFAADSHLHAQTMAFAADAAEAQGFNVRSDGEPREWKTVEAFGHALGVWAKRVRRAAIDTAPVTVYGEDVVNIDNAAFPAEVAWLNHLRLAEVETAEGVATPWLRMQWLLYPYAPSLDLGDVNASQTIVAKLLASTAAETFPALARTSTRMAVTKLLSAKVPYQLMSGAAWGWVPSLTRRSAFVTMLGEWSSAARNETLMVQNHFGDVLLHYEAVAAWVAEVSDPHGSARQLLASGWGDHALDLAGVGLLDAGLASADVEGLWSEERGPQGNIDYLQSEFRRRRRMGDGTAGSSEDARATAHGSGARRESAGTATDGAHELERLDRALTTHIEDGGSTFSGMEIIFKSEAVPAMRFMLGHGVQVHQLPPSFASYCRGMPAKKQEYIIDTLKHLDTGAADPDLTDLTVATFYNTAKGAKIDKFYRSLFDGKLTAIHWDRDFVYPIALLLDPHAKVFEDMTEVYKDSTRLGMHVLYVGRLLDGIGKLQSAPYSFSAIVSDWMPALAKATTRGRGMTTDALREIATLMEAVWRNAESLLVASYTLGVPWTASLAEDDLSAFDNFNSWREELADHARHAKRFKAALKVANANATTLCIT